MNIELRDKDLKIIRRYLEVINSPVDDVDMEEFKNLKSIIVSNIAAHVGAEDKYEKMEQEHEQ